MKERMLRTHRLSQQWNNAKFNTKFFLAFGVFLLLIVFIAISSMSALLALERQVNTTILYSTEIQRMAMEANHAFQQAQVLHHEFFARYSEIGLTEAQTRYVNPANHLMAEVITMTDSLKRLITEAELEDKIDTANIELDEYNKISEEFRVTFIQTAALLSVQMSADTGLIFELNQSGEKIKNLTIDQPDLLPRYLMLESLEKEFYVTRQSLTVSNMLHISTQLRKVVEGSNSMSPIKQQELLTEIDIYKAISRDILDVDRKIREQFIIFERESAIVQDISERLVDVAKEEINKGQARIHQATQGVIRDIVMIAIGGALLAIIAAYIFQQTITKKLLTLTTATQAFQDDHRQIMVAVDSTDELGQLTEAFNQMSQKISSLLADLEQQASEISIVNNDLAVELTVRKQAESKLRQSQIQLKTYTKELARSNQELENFAYIVSHDLKAPLRGIGSLTSWLVSDYKSVIDEEGQEMLTLLQTRVKWMELLIEGILKYSRVGRSLEEEVSIDLNDLVPKIIDVLAPPAQIQIDICRKLPIIRGENTKVTQVFQNLISNAIKYMDKVDGYIWIDYEASDQFWTFTVSDNGPGIAPEYHKKIFQIFQTLQPRDELTSSGVGLSLVKKIVELNGGEIRLDSHPGDGAKFIFTWPKDFIA